MANEITPFPPPRGTQQATSPQGTGPVRGPQPTAETRLTPPRPETRQQRAGARGGFHALLDEALGRVRLPDAIELVAALEAARDHAALADKAVPGLGRLVTAVIEDETRKLTRYLDLRGQ